MNNLNVKNYGNLPFPTNEIKCTHCDEIFAVNLDTQDWPLKGEILCPKCDKPVSYSIYVVMEADEPNI